jgi:Na+-translocating ferredoxin:NAD+ oxidoreductase RnfE subunit
MDTMITSAARARGEDARLAVVLATLPGLIAADTLVRGLALAATAVAAASAARLGARVVADDAAPAMRLAAGLVAGAGCIALVQLVLRALTFEVHLAVSASLVLALPSAGLLVLRARSGTHDPTVRAAWFLLPALLIAFGAARELLGRGTLLSLGPAGDGFALLAAPAGALIAAGLLVAALSALSERHPKPAP